MTTLTSETIPNPVSREHAPPGSAWTTRQSNDSSPWHEPAMTPASRLLHGALRLARNLLLDLRFGGFLGGSLKTSHSAVGAYDVSNSDYRALSCLFADRVLPGDQLVDLGCGKG